MSSQPSSQSILALVLQHLFPSLKNLPPSFYFDHTSDSTDISHHHFLRRKSSGYSTHSSESASSNSSDHRLSFSLPDRKGCLDDHFDLLLASQARARAARHPLFTLSSSLWTLKEYPSPYLPQVGEGHRSTAIPPDRLSDGPSIASSELSTPPREGRVSEKSKKSNSISKHSRSGHGRPFRLLPFHRRVSRSLSPTPPGQSRRTSPPPHLLEGATPPERDSSSDQDHRRTSVRDYGTSVSPSGYQSLISLSTFSITVRRVAPGHKDNQERKRKAEGQASVSRVGRSRTDPYQAPYFFPSPMSPGAYDYVQLVQHNRKPVLSDRAHTPMSTEERPHAEEDGRSSSLSRGRLRSVWPALHRRSSSHS